jgi:hypothetical protein
LFEFIEQVKQLELHLLQSGWFGLVKFSKKPGKHWHSGGNSLFGAQVRQLEAEVSQV